MKSAQTIISKTNLFFGLRLFAITAILSLLVLGCPTPGSGSGGGTTVATPTIAPAAGTIFHATDNITMTCATSGAVIHYTVDNSTPPAASPLVFTVPIAVSTFPEGALHVKAIATLSGTNSAVTADYLYNVVDDLGPTPVITSTQSGGVNDDFPITVTFSEPISTVPGNEFSQADLEAGLTNATCLAFDGSANPVFTATIHPTTVGNVTIDIAAGLCSDVATAPNGNLAAAQFSIYFDPNAPIAVISSAAPDPLNASQVPVHITITFDRNVQNFDSTDLTLNNCAVANFNGTSPGAIYTADITPSAEGAFTIDIGAGVCSSWPSNSPNVPSLQFSRVYDTTGPTVTINQGSAQADPSNSSSINFEVVFSEATTDFGTSDVTVSGTAGPTTALVTGSGTAYNVAVSGMTTDGTVSASIAAGVATDAASNPNAASTSTDNTVNYDGTSPTGSLNQAAAQADPSNIIPVNFTVIFSEPVTGFDDSDVTLSGTAGAATAVVTGSLTTYNVAVSGMTGDGTVTAGIAAGRAHDAAGNANTASSSSDDTVTFDASALNVTVNQAAAQADPTNGATIDFTVVFTKPVADFATGEVTLSGTAGATTAVVTGTGTTYNVAVSGMTGTGTVSATIPAGVAHDAASNANFASSSTDNTVTFDDTAPGVALSCLAPDPTNSGYTVTFTFSEPINPATFSAADFDFTVGSGTASVPSTSDDITWTSIINPSVQGSVTVTLNANAVQDLAGNFNTAAPAGITRTWDTIAPTVTINQAAAQADPTNASPINFTVVFSEATTDFATGDVNLSGTAGATTAIVTGSGTTYNAAVSGITGTGTVIAAIGMGSTHDAAGNANTASTSTDNTVNYDATSPTVIINQAAAQADPTNAGPLNFTVVFSESVSDFATGDVTLSGTAGAVTATVTGSGTTYNVAVTGMTGTGTVIATIAAGRAHDAATNANTVSTSTDNTVNYDVTAPGLTLSCAAPNPTNLGYTVTFTFTEPVTGFDSSDIDFTAGSGTASVPSTSDDITWTSIINPSAQGSTTVTVNAAAVQDLAGNNNTAATNSVTRTWDTVAPTVTINQAAAQADPTNASPLNFTVVFSEATTDFATGDVNLSGTAGATTATVTGSGTTYNVAVSGMTGDGTVIATIGMGSAHDAAGNANTASTSTDNTVTCDGTPPTVIINQAAAQADPANTAPINFTVVFSKSVSDFATGDVSLSGTAGATTATVTGSGTTYNVAVTGMTGSGTVIASIPAGAAHDASSNGNVASTSTDNTVAWDNIAPTVTINQAAAQADPTNASPINFTVTFSESVSDFATGDVSLSGTAGATTATVTGSGTTYNVAVTGMTGTGTVIATLAAGVAHDAATNASAASTSTDNAVAYDITSPAVTINQAVSQSDPINASPINFTVTFSESVSDFATGDVSLSGTAGATTATVTGSGTTYNVAVSGMSAQGTVIATLAAGAAHDASTNASAASTSTDNSVTWDTAAPTAAINQGSTQVDPTNTSPIVFDVVFNEAVSGFITGDVAISGTAGGAKTATVSGGPSTYTVSVTGMTTGGTVIASIGASVCGDAAGNNNAASTSTDNTVTWDITAPTVTINQAAAQADPAVSSPINFTVVFSENVTGFATGDVTLSGTAGATTATITGGPATYNVAVSGMTGEGTVIADIAPGVASDAAGNTNAASTSTDKTVTYALLHTVTYNGNGSTGGTAPTDGNTYITGNSVTVLGNSGGLTLPGYSFIGWCVNTDGSGTTYLPGNTFTMGTSNVTLYADWSALPTYNVTYTGGSGVTGNPPVDGTSYIEGSTVTVLGNVGTPPLAKAGNTFTGWDDLDASSFYTPGNQFVIDGPITLTAKWSANPTYSVTYFGNGNTGGTVPVDSTNYENGALVTVSGNTGNLVKTGNSFTGWNTAANGSGTSYTGGNTFNMGSANVSLYAQYSALPTYTVTYNGNGSTGGSVPTDGSNYLTGATVTVLGNTGSLVRTGYAFTGWNTLANGSGTTYNPAQTFAMGSSNVNLYALWSADSSTSWTNLHSASLPYAEYDAVTTSADGTKIVAVIQNGTNPNSGIYRSANSGTSWTRVYTTTRAFRCVASSSDGTYIAAGVSTGNIFVSANSGTTWTARASSQAWRGVAMSSSGQFMVGAIGAAAGRIYRSVDYGVTWNLLTGSATANYRGIASSADGTVLAAIVDDGGIYVSTNSGTNWTQKLAMVAAWRGISISGDGTKMSAAIQAGTYPNSGIWVSTDSGNTWSQTDTLSVSYRCLAMSNDGSKVGVGIKGTTGGYVSFSANYGANWYQRTYTGLLVWTGIAASSTGARFYITNNGATGSVWVYTQ